jgi:transketolase
LLDLGESHPEAVVLVGDLGRYVDALPFAERYPDRFLQMGMSEQNIIGTAAGLAKTGLLPIVVTYGVFISRRAYDQVAMALVTGATRAILVGFMPGITTPFRATHQAIDDVAHMRVLPGVVVLDPADELDIRTALAEASSHHGTSYIRVFRGEQPALPLVGGRGGTIIGSAVELFSDGSHSFISTGLGTQWAMEARELLGTASILHVPGLKPLDVDAVARFCATRDRVVCVENHSVIGGLSDAVAAVIASHGLGTRLTSAGVPDAWPPSGSIGYLRQQLGLTGEALAALASEGSRA